MTATRIREVAAERSTLTAEQARRLSRHMDAYELAPFVGDLGWLRTLPARPPRNTDLGHLRVSGANATVLLEFERCTVAIDPSPESVSILERSVHPPNILALTHAHHDHAAGFCAAARRFPRADLLMTRHTLDLLCLEHSSETDFLRDMMNDRGFVVQDDGGPQTLSGITVRAFQAGHLVGNVMYDIAVDRARVLVTSDFTLRPIADLEGAVWPTGDYSALIMSSTHAWDPVMPAPNPYMNREDLVRQCEAAAESGTKFIAIAANALGESQEAYIALARAQMSGRLRDYRIKLGGKADLVAATYARESSDAFSPWRVSWSAANHMETLGVTRSILIAGADMAGRMHATTTGDSLLLQKRSEASIGTSGNFDLSLHASFPELAATALVTRCQRVYLYHAGDNSGQSPLADVLRAAGRDTSRLPQWPTSTGV